MSRALQSPILLPASRCWAFGVPVHRQHHAQCSDLGRRGVGWVGEAEEDGRRAWSKEGRQGDAACVGKCGGVAQLPHGPNEGPGWEPGALRPVGKAVIARLGVGDLVPESKGPNDSF